MAHTWPLQQGWRDDFHDFPPIFSHSLFNLNSSAILGYIPQFLKLSLWKSDTMAYGPMLPVYLKMRRSVNLHSQQ